MIGHKFWICGGRLWTVNDEKKMVVFLRVISFFMGGVDELTGVFLFIFYIYIFPSIYDAYVDMSYARVKCFILLLSCLLNS